MLKNNLKKKMKNLSNYINERLVLSKDNDNTLSRVNLEPGQFIMRVSDFYAWYCRKRSFDDISIKFIEDHNIWADLVDNGTFKNIQEVRDFIKDFADLRSRNEETYEYEKYYSYAASEKDKRACTG